MGCNLTEQELWSGLDRHAPEIEAHIADCATCQERAAGFHNGVAVLTRASHPPAPPIPARIGSYLIRRRLGHGGMGIVYEGEQQAPRRLVAIKVIRGGWSDASLDEYRVRLFQREAQTLARLRHPAIAAIFEGGRTDDGQHFFAMELVRGIPLNEYVRGRNLPMRSRLRLFCQICEAINYAHQRGVIHRDLKPTNILVDPGGNPKVLDFGLARITDGEAALTTTATVTGRIMGTLAYMSPEEAAGSPDDIDVRSDVYSLGVMCYELLTHRLPYTVKRTALPEAVRVICEEPPRRPSSIERSVRGDLETIALKALEKEPARRYQSVAAFSDDVQRYLSDQPILARRAGPVYRLRKLLVRHKVFVFALMIMAGLSGAGAAWLLRAEYNLQASHEMTVALEDRRNALIHQGFAQKHHKLGEFYEAEQEYEAALATFQRLGRSDYVAKAKVGLAKVLTDRWLSVQSDQEAEGHDASSDDEAGGVHADDRGDLLRANRLLVDALVDAFDKNPVAWAAEKREALEQLLVLYGPDLLDAPKERAKIKAELEEMERLREAEEAALESPPPPSS